MPTQAYADAFFSIASPTDLENYAIFTSCVEEQFMAIMDSKRITLSDKHEMIDQMLGSNNVLANFIKVLIDNERFGLCKEINAVLQTLVDRKNNVMRVDITTSVALTTSEISDITARLKKIYNQNIILNETVDKSIIGGMRLKYAGKVLDLTISNKVNELKKELSR